jgi:hypothetical protein
MREYAELLERVEGLEAALRTANDMVCRHSMPHGWTVFQEKHRLPPAWVVVETPPPSVCTEHHVCRPPIDGPHEPASGSNWTCPSCKTHWVYEGAWVLLSKALRDAPHPWGPGCAHDPECATELEHSLVTEEPAPRTSDPLVRCWRCKHEVPESTTVCNAGIGTQCKDSKSCRGRSYGPHPRTKEAPPECRVWCSVDQPCPECTPQRTSKIDAALVRLEREYGHRTNEASSQVKDGAPNLNSDAGNERQLMQRTDSPVYSLAYIARIAIDGGPSFSIPCRVPEPEAISMFEAIHARETLRASIQFETVAGLPRTEPASPEESGGWFALHRERNQLRQERDQAREDLAHALACPETPETLTVSEAETKAFAAYDSGYRNALEDSASFIETRRIPPNTKIPDFYGMIERWAIDIRATRIGSGGT